MWGKSLESDTDIVMLIVVIKWLERYKTSLWLEFNRQCALISKNVKCKLKCYATCEIIKETEVFFLKADKYINFVISSTF